MEDKKEIKKLSMTSTKQEMLEAYAQLQKQLQEKQAGELKPEKRIEEKKTNEAIQVAETLSSADVPGAIHQLKSDIGRMLTQIAERLEGETAKFTAIQQAVTAKEKDLQEFYEIEKTAMTLAALIEAQNQKRQEFEKEMTAKRESLKEEMELLRDEWEKEKEAHDAAVKERDTLEKKRQTREKEEFDYAFKREQQLTTERLAYEKAKQEQEIKDRKEALENELKVREAAVAEREDELADLRKRAGQFPKELETAVSRAVKDATERIILEAKSKEELLRKEFEGERNVLKTRIESLEKALKEQSEQAVRLSQQLEAAYQKVQDIAMKTVEGASTQKSLTNLDQWLGEQMRKPAAEK